VRIDGAGVVLGAKLLDVSIPKRNTWADWGWPLAAYLAEKKHSVYLLGGPAGAAEKTAELFKQKNPALRICGFHHGFFLQDEDEAQRIMNEINRTRPDVLIVGFGMPLQEKWIWENYKRLKVKVYLTAGAAFEYLSGQTRRCPKWMGDAGLEWLYRFFQNPRRMANRYLVGNVVFLANVLWDRFTSAR